MKKFLFSSIALFAATCGSLYSGAPYAQVTNYNDQTVNAGNSVVFGSEFSHDIDLLDGGQELQFEKAGVYAIEFTGVGVAVNSVPVVGNWGLSVELNGNPVNQGNVTVYNGASTERQVASWEVIVAICDPDYDRVSLVANSSSPQILLTEVNMRVTRIQAGTSACN